MKKPGRLLLTILFLVVLTACTPPPRLIPVKPIIPPAPQCLRSKMLPVEWQAEKTYCLNDQSAKNLLANNETKRACFEQYSAWVKEVTDAVAR